MALVSDSDYETFLNVTSGDAVVAALSKPIDRAIARYLRYDPQQASRTEFYPIQAHLPPTRGGRGVWETDGSRAYMTRSGGSRANDLLQLRCLPIRGTVTVYEERGARGGQKSGSFGASTELTAGTQYYIDTVTSDGDGSIYGASGILIRIGTGWPNEHGSLKVTYTAGYTSAELTGTGSTNVDASDIALAAKMLMQKTYQTIKATAKSDLAGMTAGIKQSERLGDYMYMADVNTARQLNGMSMNIVGEIAELLQPYVNMGTASTNTAL